jgi:hypothetical protein
MEIGTGVSVEPDASKFRIKYPGRA